MSPGIGAGGGTTSTGWSVGSVVGSGDGASDDGGEGCGVVDGDPGVWVTVCVNEDPRSAGTGSANDPTTPIAAAATPPAHATPTTQVWSCEDFMG